jgi:hypothetical protein
MKTIDVRAAFDSSKGQLGHMKITGKSHAVY